MTGLVVESTPVAVAATAIACAPIARHGGGRGLFAQFRGRTDSLDEYEFKSLSADPMACLSTGRNTQNNSTAVIQALVAWGAVHRLKLCDPVHTTDGANCFPAFVQLNQRRRRFILMLVLAFGLSFTLLCQPLLRS